LRLSQAVEKRIEASAARERQRGWLISTLLLAQGLMQLALVPSYIIPTLNIPMLITVGVALALYGVAFVINRAPGKLSLAVYMLIIGGGLVTTAQVYLTAILTQSGTHTAQATLYFLPIIIAAGLFLSPELTLMFAAAAGVLTAAAIPLALALAGGAGTELSAAYQIVVNALGLEALVAYMSWQLANFIFEQNTTSQTAEDLRFAQARLEALQRQMADQRKSLQREAGAIQTAVSGMLSHEYDARVNIQDGELAPLAESLNLLFERLRSTNELEHRVRRMEADVPSLVDAAGRLADAGVPAQQGSVMSDTALYPVGVALSNAQTAQARRLAGLYQLSSDIADELRESHKALEGAAADSGAALRQAGELLSLAEKVSGFAQREVDLIAQARKLLVRLLPKELTDTPPGAQRDPLLTTPSAAASTGALDGLNLDIGLGDKTGYTGNFDALPPADPEAVGIARLTMPVSALDADSSDADKPLAVFAPGELPGELVDSWGMLREAHGLAAQDQRHITSLFHDLGVLSRLVRQTETTLARSLQALDASRIRADQAQALSGGTGGDTLDESASRLNAPGASLRVPAPTRPLQGEPRLTESGGLAPLDPSSQTPSPGSLRVQDLLDPGTAPFGPGDPNDPGDPNMR
jgi:hypothetical protein